jgi:hypothetical protein
LRILEIRVLYNVAIGNKVAIGAIEKAGAGGGGVKLQDTEIPAGYLHRHGIGNDDEHDAGTVLQDCIFIGSEFVISLGKGRQTHE